MNLNSFTQLITTNNLTPTELVEQVLIGNGVSVSNVNFIGSPNSIARFNGVNTNIGMSDGIIITTGTTINNGSGPHGPNNQNNAGQVNNLPGYSLLNQYANRLTYDASVLEFDFIPSNDTVSFNFIFASEEYPEFVCSNFNDVFAFFISGPNPNGGNFVNKNIALIPGTNTPIAINNINGGQVGSNGQYINCAPSGLSNSQYYVHNLNGSTIQYDGFTTILKAISQVECGETYHLRIAIADVGDPGYDSGIFLEANSLNSKNPVTITTKVINDLFSDGKTIAENCDQGKITIDRSESDITQSLSIPVLFSGTATLNQDYNTNIPSVIQFQPGQSILTYNINGIGDNLTEGQETINIELKIPDPCKISENIKLQYYINDVPSMQVELLNDTLECLGDQISLTPNVIGGVAPYTYKWSNGSTDETIIVSPTQTETYSVTVVDNCIQLPVTASATVIVPVVEPLKINHTDDIEEICPYIEHSINANPTGGTPEYSYIWSNEDGEELGTNSTIIVKPSKTSKYKVLVTDKCGIQKTEEIKITILSPPLILTTSADTLICPGDSALITAYPTGGWGDYTYFWPHSNDTTKSVWVNPYSTTTYIVQVKDSCATFTVEKETKVEVNAPIANFWVKENLMRDELVTFHNVTLDGHTYWWDLGNGKTSTDAFPQSIYSEPGTYNIILIAWNEIGCVDTIRKPILIKPEFYYYIPNTFTPDDDRFNNYFQVSIVNPKKFRIKIFNRWGELLYESQNPKFKWDGTYKGSPVQDGIYIYKIFLQSINDDFIEENGHINLLR